MKSNNVKTPAERIISIALIGTIVAVVLATVGYLFIGNLKDKGTFKRKEIAAQSENYKVDACMFSYFFYENYRNFVNMDYDLKDKGINLDKSLKKQDCYYGGGSWYDYFLKETKAQVEEYLVLAEKATADGVSLNDAELDNIDKSVDKIKALAEQDTYKGAEYYTAMYGRGVTVKDIKNCLKLERLAVKYKAILRGNFTIDENDYASAKDINKNKSVDVYSHIFKYDEFSALINDNSTFEEYKSAVLKDMTKDYKENYDVDTDEGFAETMFGMNSAATYTFGQDETVDSFAFNDSVKDGTVKIVKGKKETTAYCVAKAPYLADYKTKNVHVVEYNNVAYGNAQAALNYANSVFGAMQEEGVSLTFVEGHAKQSTSDYLKRKEYGAYYNAKPSDFETALSEWIFSADRKPNDCAVIQGEESTYIAYFDGDGLEAYKADVYEELFAKHIKQFISKNASAFKVKLFDKVIKKV